MTMHRGMVALAFACCPAFTWAAAHPSNDFIEEIVVTAETFGRTLRDSTASVIVVTEQELAWATERDHVEILRRVPNVSIDPQDGRVGFREMPERGFGGFGTNSNMQLDGATYTPYFISDVKLPLWDVRQLEILRGAQTGAALFSATGVIAATTRDPTFEHSGEALMDFRDEGRREFGVAHGGPLIPGTLAFRVAVHTMRDPGAIDNVALGDDQWHDEERHLLRGKLLCQPAWWAGSRILFTYQGQKDVLGARSPVINRVLARDGFDPFARETAVDTPEQRRNYFNLSTLEIDHPLGRRWSANHLLSYQTRRFSDTRDFDGTAAASITLDETFRSNSLQYQSKLSYQGPWRLELGVSAIGFFPLEDQLAFVSPFDLDGPGPLPGIDLVTSFGFDDDIWGAFLFGYASRTWNDRWTLDVGGRMLRGQIDSHRQVRSQRGSTTGIPALDDFYDSIIASFPELDAGAKPDDTRFLPMAALSYALNANVSVGVRYEQGYRIGQTDVNRARATAVPYQPETSDHWGAYVRSVWLAGKLSVSGNVFHVDFDDLQLRRCFSDDPLDCNTVNAAKASSQGVEVEIAYLPHGNWNSWLAFGVTQTNYSRIRAQVQENPSQQARNDKTPWSAATGLTYSTGSGLFAGMDWTYQSAGAIGLAGNGAVDTESLLLVNARIGWRFSLGSQDAEVSAYARNLLDEEYLLFANPALPSGFAQRAVVGDAREWGLSLRIGW